MVELLSKLCFFNFIEVGLIYNVVLISSVQQSDSVIWLNIWILFFIFFHMVYRRIWNTCYTVGPCWSSILYKLCYPKLLIYPSSAFLFGNHVCFLCVWVYLCFVKKFICIIFEDSTYKKIRYLSFLVWFISLSMIISRSIHVAANGIISFSIMAE